MKTKTDSSMTATARRDKKIAERWKKQNTASRRKAWPQLTEAQRITCALGVPALTGLSDPDDFFAAIVESKKTGESAEAILRRRGQVS